MISPEFYLLRVQVRARVVAFGAPRVPRSHSRISRPRWAGVADAREPKCRLAIASVIASLDSSAMRWSSWRPVCGSAGTARYFGAQLEDRSLAPGDDARIAPTRFEDWLSQSSN